MAAIHVRDSAAAHGGRRGCRFLAAVAGIRAQTLPSPSRVALGSLVAQQPSVHVKFHHDGVHFIGKLCDIEIRTKVSTLHRQARRLLQALAQGAKPAHQTLTHRSLSVVPFQRTSEKDAAAWQLGRRFPGEPMLEDGYEPGLPAPDREGRDKHPRSKMLGGGIQDVELQFLLGLEVRKQSALRQSQITGQIPNRQPLQTDRAGQTQRVRNDALARFIALAQAQAQIIIWHATEIARTFGFKSYRENRQYFYINSNS